MQSRIPYYLRCWRDPYELCSSQGDDLPHRVKHKNYSVYMAIAVDECRCDSCVSLEPCGSARKAAVDIQATVAVANCKKNGVYDSDLHRIAAYCRCSDCMAGYPHGCSCRFEQAYAVSVRLY